MRQKTNRAGPKNAIRKFFNDNPDEELSTMDVVTKFRINLSHARTLIFELRHRGELAVLRKEGKICFYGRAG